VNERLTVCDLFSGSGAMSLAAEHAGLDVVCHCEIDKFPRAVLQYRFPKIPLHDDVKTLTKEKFYELTGRETVDIVAGGSPCQDLSVAGKQRGLDGARSGLFFEQMRVARELNARYIIWENVPGALSSNGGADFAAIISEFTGWSRNAYSDYKFGNAGVFKGRTESDYSVCYRILDTRFFGIPQRRRRIYLVASLGTKCRPEILFERNGVRGNFAKSCAQGQDVAAFAESGAIYCDKTAKTLPAHGQRLNADENFVVYENHMQDSRIKEVGCAPTLSAKAGTGGGNLPIVLHATQDPICSDIRRLTPKECERLQGMPDDWTKIPYRGKPAEKCPDSPRYKAMGNGVTKHVAQWVFEGVLEDFKEERKAI